MSLSLILPLTNGAVLRARFFQSHGVTLECESRSRSGVREDDGMVVFALPAERTRVDAWGCSCLLWSSGDGLPDDAVSAQTQRHCRIAMQQGLAEGFLLGRNQAPVEPQDLLALRVVKVGAEYWARWGNAARAERSRGRASSRSERSQ